MGILELILLILIVAAIFGRGRLAMGVVLDILIGLLVLGLVWRLLMVLF